MQAPPTYTLLPLKITKEALTGGAESSRGLFLGARTPHSQALGFMYPSLDWAEIISSPSFTALHKWWLRIQISGAKEEMTPAILRKMGEIKRKATQTCFQAKKGSWYVTYFRVWREKSWVEIGEEGIETLHLD